MKLPEFKKWQVIAAICLLVLIILNPSLSRFREFAGDNKAYLSGHNYKKVYNFVIVSVFYDENFEQGQGIYYVGVLNNFIKI